MSDDDWGFEGDQLASDDPAFEEILQRSVIDIQQQMYHVSSTSINYTAKSNGRNHTTTAMNTNDDIGQNGLGLQNWEKKQELKRRIAEMDADIQSLKESIKSLNTQVELKQDQKEAMVKSLNELDRLSNANATRNANANVNTNANGKGKGRAGLGQQGINYMDGDFEWVGGLKARMRNVFGIDEFRLCQRGICNANMDGRDIVVVMPTGGGKSLTYQLPALLTPGCTLVISPLIALITDQILHLRANGIKAVTMTSGTPSGEKKDIFRQLTALAERRPNSKEEEIKLCYITPERLTKDNSFVSLLQKLASGGKLARIVIDEAHCVSAMGHAFRPDYQKLHRLRQLLPSIPIMALSATCPPLVLKDLLKTLRLGDIVDGRNAKATGTVYFSAPLYRKNLHYRVVPKPSKASDVTKVMVDYILENHPNETGIVYCLSRKNTETVAQELQELSNGKIKTGVYHADKTELEKTRLHSAWRDGQINVVCATIAFGLGIDKGDVRFVLHHSMSKSLEGYYQESGRAGRDGKDADCVLFYRPQDGSTLASMVAGEKSGQEQLHAILEFAEELEECRKIHFAKYFSHSSNLSISSWTTEDQDALQRCGHCDNCLRPPESIDKNKDVSLYTWQILQIINHVQKAGGKVTINMLAGLARNIGGGAFDVVVGGGGKGRRGKGKEKEKVCLDLDSVAGGVVDLPRDDIEHLIVKLLIKGYLKEEYQQTAYSTNVHVVPGNSAGRFIHETKETIVERCKTRPMLTLTLAKPGTTKKRGRSKRKEKDDGVEIADDDDDGIEGDVLPPTKKQRTAASTTIAATGIDKGKKKADVVPIQEEGWDVNYNMYLDDEPRAPVTRRRSSKNSKPSTQATQARLSSQPTTRNSTLASTSNSNSNKNSDEYDFTELVDLEEIEDDSDDNNILYGWSKSMREKPVVRRRIKQTPSIIPADKEVLELSD